MNRKRKLPLQHAKCEFSTNLRSVLVRTVQFVTRMNTEQRSRTLNRPQGLTSMYNKTGAVPPNVLNTESMKSMNENGYERMNCNNGFVRPKICEIRMLIS